MSETDCLSDPKGVPTSGIRLGICGYLKLPKNAFTSKTETTHIVFAADNNYAPHCAAAMASILANSTNETRQHFYILDGGISAKNKDKIIQLKKMKDFDLSFYNMKNVDFSGLPLNRAHISVATYYRLHILDILPKNIQKIIYLDCDIIVEKDIKELWDMDISDYYAGTVEDEGSLTQLRKLQLPLEHTYFNAGILVLNLNALRQFDFQKACIDYYKTHRNVITLQDQDILNGVFQLKCKKLPLCWNTNSRIYLGNELEHVYSVAEEREAGLAPSIIHYTDAHKPWKMTCVHPLKNEYYRYVCLTPYKTIMSVLLADIRRCQLFLGCSKTILFISRCFKKIIETIFSIKNSKNKKRKVITVLGIRFKFKRKRKL